MHKYYSIHLLINNILRMKRQLKRSNEVIMLAASHYVTTSTTARMLTGNTSSPTPVIDSMANYALAITNGDVNRTNAAAGSNYNQVLTATTIGTQKPNIIELFNKVPTTTLKYPLKNIKYFSSTLNADYPVEVNVDRYKAPTTSVWSIKAGTQTFAPNTTYQIEMKFKGRTMDEYYSTEGLIHSEAVLTPNYASGTATINVANYVLGNAAIGINSASPLNFPQYRGRVPAVVLGVADATYALTGALAGTAFSALPASGGTVLNVWNSKRGMKAVDLSAIDIAAIQKAVASGSFATGDKLVPLDPTNIANLSLASTSCLKGLIVLALDREYAWEDFVAETKTNIDNVGVSKGFDKSLAVVKQEEFASEGTNTRKLWLQFRNTFSQRLYTKLFDERANITYPNPIDLTKTYGVISIEHSNEHSSDLGHLTIDPFKTLILVEDTGGAEPAIMTTLKAALDAFLTANAKAVSVA